MSLFKNRGLSQISILIHLLVITFVVVLAITWQMYVTRKEQDKFNNKIAAILANDIANRMQLNYPESMKGKSSFYVYPTNTSQKAIVEHHIDHYCDNDPIGCHAHTTAANDLTYWQQAILDNLPNGLGEINIIANNLNAYAVTIKWQDPSTNKKRTFTTNILLPHKPWQYICDLNKHSLDAPKEHNNLHKAQMIYDTIMGNKHNYKKFDFTAYIFNDYLEQMDNINLSLADELCVASCKSSKTLANSSNLCDCNKEKHFHSINFTCENNENN